MSLLGPVLLLAALLVAVALAPIRRVVTRVVFLAFYLLVPTALFICLVVVDADRGWFLILGVTLGPGTAVGAFRIIRAVIRKA